MRAAKRLAKRAPERSVRQPARRWAWWRETMRLRLVLAGSAVAIVLGFVLIVPYLAPLLGGRGAALLRPAFALALLAGLLLMADGWLAPLHRRHDKRAD